MSLIGLINKSKNTMFFYYIAMKESQIQMDNIVITVIILLMSESRVFPLRLPPNYHGRVGPIRKLSEINHQKMLERDNPQYPPAKISNWMVKRLDRDIIQERNDFLVHPAKISGDTPDWFKTTFHYFHRANHPLRNRLQEKADNTRFTVFNERKQPPFGTTAVSDASKLNMSRREKPVAEKVGVRETSYGTVRWLSQSEVTPKIGSVQIRDYSIRKPLLKIGYAHENNFINTYSIA